MDRELNRPHGRPTLISVVPSRRKFSSP